MNDNSVLNLNLNIYMILQENSEEQNKIHKDVKIFTKNKINKSMIKRILF